MSINNNGGHQHTNGLSQETSPYLLQHQHNPVDWYAWGPEAFERARRDGKPIFLSVGYSTCYWCHVMERQSFENEEIAALMNRLFVCIKVDREERPDVDQLYMTAVQIISRQGGWPMSVFLTPDLQPFFGGTYYPPTDMHGRAGFPRICQAIDDAWRNRRADVDESCGQIVSVLQRLAKPAAADGIITVDPAFLGSMVDRAVADYEPDFGGFGHAPKFPRETVIELLLTYLASDLDEKKTRARVPKAEVRRRTLHALDAMMHGGIRDHLGGGFHRYSTDQKWLVPHFEIMLYDNAMLLGCYAEAFRQTGDPRYAQVARDIADFVLREMTSPQGGFYTAMDAEVDGQEGLNYLWTAEEIESVLGAEDAKRFNAIYGVDEGPNFADPHHGNGVPEKNILFLNPGVEWASSPCPPTESAGLPSAGQTETRAGSPCHPFFDAALREMRQKLYGVRQKRKQPLLDTKILTSWNALMIRGLAIAGECLDEPRYVEAANRCAEFLLSEHRTPEGGLFRTSREGVKKHAGTLEDYAYLAWALTTPAIAGRWRGAAGALADAIAARFGDATAGGFFFTDRSADDLIIRQKTATDSPLPSGNAAAALALLALDRANNATATIGAFTPALLEQAEGMSAMVQAAMLAVLAAGPFAVKPASSFTAPSVEQFIAPAKAAQEVVELSARWLGERDLLVLLAIRGGWHVNANQPGGQGLIGVTLTIEPPESGAAIEYPSGELLALDFATEPVRVYSGMTEIRVHFSGELQVMGGVSLMLRYQACDDSSCLPPVTRRVPLT